MLNSLFNGLFDSPTMEHIGIPDFLECILCALVLGLLVAFTYTYKTRYTKSFFVTLAVLPAVVCVIIMMVNGNIGAGVAVAGAFGLVRFRSAPGTAKEIITLFLAMGTGLIAGMGYLAFSALYTVLLCVVLLVYSRFDFGAKRNDNKYKTLRILIPEDLDYSDVFDGILTKYAESFELTNVKTTNMGSLYKLTYDIVLRHPDKEKEMIDKLRCRNGNLEISISKQSFDSAML